MRKKIGECLIQAGLISEEDLQVALADHKKTGERVGAVLVRLNLATEKQITKALAYQLGFPYVSLSDEPPDPAAIVLISKEVALKRVCVAVKLEKNLLTVAMSDPLLFSLVQDLEFQTGYRIKQVVATRTDILDAIENGYPDKALTKYTGVTGGLAVPAAQQRSGGRPGEPSPGSALVPRNDVDIFEQASAPAVGTREGSDSAPIIDLVDLVVNSAITSRASDVHIEPMEKGVLVRHRLDGILKEVMDLPKWVHEGLVARMKITAITSIKSGRTNIITIEDPIEYQIPGINQTQVNEKAKLTFAGALRAILRQDPDVILVGEIRDHETAKIAMQASQTGHLVLSTLHTDDAPSTVTRLMDMNLEPYIIASAVIGVVAQRLVRRLCQACRRQYTPEAETLRSLNMTESDAAHFAFYRAVGCEECNHTGYRGRMGIYEVMRISDKVRRLIAQKAGEDMVRDAAIAAGMITLGEDALAKVKSGATSAEELFRVVTEVKEVRTLCPGCHAAVGVDFMACPHCGHRLNSGCPKCGRSLQAGWQFCPYCTTSTTARPTKRQLRDQRRTPELPASNVAEFKNQNNR